MKIKISTLLMEAGVSYNKQRLHKVGYFRELLASNPNINEGLRPLLRLCREMVVRLSKTESALVRSLECDPLLRRRVERLASIPAIGPITALTWALEISEVQRFSSIKKAISYCGLCGDEQRSANSVRRTPLSKQRNKHLQTTLIEAAKMAPRGVAGHPANAASFSHQTAAVDVRRFSDRDAQQRRSLQGQRTTPTIPEERLGSRPQPKLQSRSEKSVERGGRDRLEQARSVSGILCSTASHRHEGRDGSPDPGQKDCHHRVDCVEERSVLRRPTSETTNSLSVFDRVRSILGIFSSGGRRVLETLWFESESQLVSWARCASGT